MTYSAPIRFLRARKFDVAAAKKMLHECEQWRKEFGIEEIMKYGIPSRGVIHSYSIPGTLTSRKREMWTSITLSIIIRWTRLALSTNRCPCPLQSPFFFLQDGRPLYIERLGYLNIKELYRITSQERQLQRLVYEYEKNYNERLPACSKACGHPVETSCTILDLWNVSLSNFYQVKDYVMSASSIGQNRYPESMGKFYIINAPWAFSAVWRIIKPWLDEVTVSKIDIIGSDYKDKLLAQIPAENLPKDFGGLCQCEGGCSLSDAGPWNPIDAAAHAPAANGDGAPNGNAA